MYSDIIKETTGCNDAEADRIEDFMRDVVFRSTLDWQSREQLKDGARLAKEALISLEQTDLKSQ